MKTIPLILLLACITVLNQSCKKDKNLNEDYQGTAICASEDFRYSAAFMVNGSVSPTGLDFNNSPYFVALTATMNEKVAWEIKIQGQTSGAVKTFTGTSTVVDVKWYGNADADVFFQTGETCTISLTPSCKEAVTITTTITHASDFMHYGFMLYDMDHVTYPEYSASAQTVTPGEPSPQGGMCNYFYAAQGTSGWYIGYSGKTVNLTTFAAGLSSEDIYVNFYLKGNTNTVVTLKAMERVGSTNYPFSENVNITWTGWKMISLKLSDLNVGNPANVYNLSFSINNNSFNAETEAYIDFAIVTIGKPFSGAN